MLCPMSLSIPQRNRDGSWAKVAFRHSNFGWVPIPVVPVWTRGPKAGTRHLAQPAVFFMLWRTSGDSRVRWRQPTTGAPLAAGQMERSPPAMKAATLASEIAPAAGASDRLRPVVLVRIAGAEGRLTRAGLAHDLAQIVPQRLPAAAWRALIDSEIAGLLADGSALEA